MSTPPFDVTRAHRWFAVELNNLAWELVEADKRSAKDIERMLHAAHGACFHWIEVGNVLNHLRAECLLATAYAKAGLPESAVRYAEQCLALGREAGASQTGFDRATTHGCASVAYLVADRPGDARSHYQLARQFADQLPDPSETQLFDRLYPAPS